MSNTIDPPIVAVGTNGMVTFDGQMVIISAKRSMLQRAHDERIPVGKIAKIHTKPAGWTGGSIHFAAGETLDSTYNALYGRGGVMFTEKQQPEFVRLYRAVKRRMAGEEDWARIDPRPESESQIEAEPQAPWWKNPWVVVPLGILGALLIFQMGWALFDPEGYEARMAEAAAEREAERQAEADGARTELVAYLDQADAAIEPCERGYAGLVDRMSGFSGSMDARTDLFQLADQVHFVCLERSSDLRTIDVPSRLGDDQERGAEAMRDACEDSLDSIARFASAIRDVAEYGLSPSRNSGVELALDAVKADALACTASRGAVEVEAVG